jgi:hypothetical protein
MNLLRVSSPVALAICSFALIHGNVGAQNEQSSSAQSSTIKLEAGEADRAAASGGSNYTVHIHPTRSASTGRYSPLPIATGSPAAASAPSNLQPEVSKPEPAVDSAVADASTVPGVPSPGFYPADLSYFGGPLVESAQFHPVYVDCAETCWGNPAKFLHNLSKSSFIHLADQYVGSTANNRYSVGTAGIISYPILTALSDNDILQIVHTAASVLGTGYGHIYHVFLPKGVDECFVGTSECYSPDVPSTFFFCAYHGSVTFSDIGHVLFTVEPYQDVPGCSMLQPSPNGGLVDSTSSVLGHETFETITDPDPPTGWIAVNSLGVNGEEIGDLCPGFDINGPYFEDPISVINGMKYEVQPMYSNKYHACAFAP